MKKIAQVAFGVIWFIFGLGIMVKIYFWLPIIIGLLSNYTFPTVVAWISAFILLVISVFIAPILLIIDGFKL